MQKVLKLLYDLENMEVGRLAMIMAMSVDREQENLIKSALINAEYRFCVTEVGGEWGDFKKSFSNLL